MNRLRFSVHNDGEAVRLELGGSLTGADVETVYQAWQSEAWTEPFKPVILDITAITEAEKHGRALLVMMNRFGAEIIARSPESSAIVQPLVTEPLASATSKPRWLGRLIRFFRDLPLTDPTFPLRAEWISRCSISFGPSDRRRA